MKKMAVVLSIVALAVIGCSGVRIVAIPNEEQVDIPKTFFDRTITYQVEAEAKKYMIDLESLLCQIKQLQAPLRDDVVLPLYRDSDIDRDRRITAAEAKAFYSYCILKFEDSLGPVQFQ